MILGRPVINYISSAMTSVEGNIATLTCNATNDPDAVAIYQLRIEWYRSNGDKVYQGNHTAIIVDGQITGELRSSLQFDPVDPADNGTYKCRASNHPEFYAELSTSLTVECMWLIMYMKPYYVYVCEQASIIEHNIICT